MGVLLDTSVFNSYAGWTSAQSCSSKVHATFFSFRGVESATLLPVRKLPIWIATVQSVIILMIMAACGLVALWPGRTGKAARRQLCLSNYLSFLSFDQTLYGSVHIASPLWVDMEILRKVVEP